MSRFPAISPTDLDLLREYDTPTICNVVELFDLCPITAFYMDRRIQACFPQLPPMVGFAATATYRSASPAQKGDLFSSLTEQVAAFANLPGPAVVVFQDLDDPPVSANFGEVLCTTYKAFGAAGLVTSGAGRDLTQVESLNFPCFSGGTICAHGHCHIVDLNVPVRVGGLTVFPGDMLHGDRNGVARLPAHLVPEIVDACPALTKAEGVVLDYLRSGKATKEGFAAAGKEAARQIEALAKRLSAIGRQHPATGGRSSAIG